MAKGNQKKTVAVRGVKKETVAKQVVVKKEPTEKAAKELQDLNKSAELLKLKIPSHWPAGAVPNPRAFGPLPEGWRHAKMVTGASGRGDGGNLHRCFIGPESKMFWHTKDLEKHLGVKIERCNGDSDIRRDRPTAVSLQEFPRGSIIRRTTVMTGADFILKRCDALAGLTVEEALKKLKYPRADGKSLNYNISDLRYDLKGGRLKLEGAKGGRTSKCTASVKRTAEMSAAAVKKKVVKTVVKKEVKQAPSAVARGRSTRASTPAHARSEPSSSSKGPSPSEAVGLKHIQSKLLAPLKKCAAAGAKGEADIFALLGVGHSLGMDGVMLGVLPEILRKAPAARGAFGANVLRQFEAELQKRV